MACGLAAFLLSWLRRGPGSRDKGTLFFLSLLKKQLDRMDLHPAARPAGLGRDYGGTMAGLWRCHG